MRYYFGWDLRPNPTAGSVRWGKQPGMQHWASGCGARALWDLATLQRLRAPECMTDGRQPIRQFSGNLEKFQAGKGELKHSSPRGLFTKGSGGLGGPEHLAQRCLTRYFE